MTVRAEWQGARVRRGPEPGVELRVWAPDRRRVEVVVEGGAGRPGRRALLPEGSGFFSLVAEDLAAGTRYRYLLDGEGPFPDPASRFQPEGVHGPSEVIDLSGLSRVPFSGRSMEELVIYELHVGTFTAEGTFEAASRRLGDLAALGITAIELMPLGDFPGARNWGYDGVCTSAPARCYGRPEELCALIDSAHRLGLAVLIDVVYNHLGPDGNYLACYARGYFTRRHQTPWGEAVNLDGESSAPVREWILQNAEMWIRDYQADGLRLDATHAIFDDRQPGHILAELAERARAAGPGRQVVVIAEDHGNERKLLLPLAAGYGLDGVWADDLHHQLVVMSAGDRDGYYADYTRGIDELVHVLRRGWLYEGQHSRYWNGPRGTPAEGIPPWRMVVCLENHDQVGNRAFGERLQHRIAPELYRALTALLLSSPTTPLLFQGQEFGASSPFLYFTDHHPELGRLVTQGRRGEFAEFESFRGDPASIPDPQAEETFARSRLRWEEREAPPGRALLSLHRELLGLRSRWQEELGRSSTTDRLPFAHAVEPIGQGRALALRRSSPERELLLLLNLDAAPLELALDTLEITRAPLGGAWRLVVDSEEPRFVVEGGRPCRFEGGIFARAAVGAAILLCDRNRGG